MRHECASVEQKSRISQQSQGKVLPIPTIDSSAIGCPCRPNSQPTRFQQQKPLQCVEASHFVRKVAWIKDALSRLHEAEEELSPTPSKGVSPPVPPKGERLPCRILPLVSLFSLDLCSSSLSPQQSSCEHGFAFASDSLECPDAADGVGIAEDGVSCYEHVGSCLEEVGCVVEGDSSIHLDEGGRAGTCDEAAGLADLLVGGGEEGLSAKAGLDGHDENHVKGWDQLSKGRNGGGRAEGYAGLHTCGADGSKGAGEVGGGLDVDRHSLDAEGSKTGSIAGRISDHEMKVKGLMPEAGDSFEDGEAKGDVGHEYTIHHIEMEPIGSGLNEGELVGEVAEVGSKERGRDKGCHGVVAGGVLCATARMALRIAARGVQGVMPARAARIRVRTC